MGGLVELDRYLDPRITFRFVSTAAITPVVADISPLILLAIVPALTA